MIKILFICHGNICRSPMAEFVMKDLVRSAGREADFVIASAATSREEIGHDIHYGTRRKLEQMHIPFSRRQAVQLTRADYANYDLLIAMDAENLQGIRRIIGTDLQKKVHLLLEYCGEPWAEVADPWYTGDFDATYNDVVRGCRALLAQRSDKHLPD